MMGVPTFYTRLLAEPGIRSQRLPHHAIVHFGVGTFATGYIQ